MSKARNEVTQREYQRIIERVIAKIPQILEENTVQAPFDGDHFKMQWLLNLKRTNAVDVSIDQTALDKFYSRLGSARPALEALPFAELPAPPPPVLPPPMPAPDQPLMSIPTDAKPVARAIEFHPSDDDGSDEDDLMGMEYAGDDEDEGDMSDGVGSDADAALLKPATSDNEDEPEMEVDEDGPEIPEDDEPVVTLPPELLSSSSAEEDATEYDTAPSDDEEDEPDPEEEDTAPTLIPTEYVTPNVVYCQIDRHRRTKSRRRGMEGDKHSFIMRDAVLRINDREHLVKSAKGDFLYPQ